MRVQGGFRRAMARLLSIESSPDATVLVVTSGWPNPDNPTRCIFVKRQMDSLARRGVEYDVLFVRGDRSSLAYPVAAFVLAVWNVTRKHQYRLVHAHGGEVSLAAWFYRRAPLVTSYLGGDLLGNTVDPQGRLTLRGRLRCQVIRQHSRLSRRTITKSLEMERVLPSRVRRRNSVIPNGVDTGVFAPAPQQEARRQLGWDATERVVLYAADPTELRKRYSLAQQATHRASETLGNVRLAVAHRVEPREVPVYMNAADCLVLLSWMEGSPNVVKEALMCNLPIVATPVGDVPELLADVHPSFLVAPTVDAVASALDRCLREPQRSDGRAKSDRLDEAVIADQVLALYAAVA